MQARAWDFDRPLLVAPAMNTFMWESPFTARHLAELESLGVDVIPPVSPAVQAWLFAWCSGAFEHGHALARRMLQRCLTGAVLSSTGEQEAGMRRCGGWRPGGPRGDSRQGRQGLDLKKEMSFSDCMLNTGLTSRRTLGFCLQSKRGGRACC